MARAKTSGEGLATAERRAFVLAMRKTGATYRKIAAAALVRFGADALPESWGERYAHKDIARELERIQAEMAEDGTTVLLIELERLDRLTEALWSRATAGDDAAIDRVLKLMDRRARYLGLDARQKVDVGGPTRVTFGYDDTMNVIQDIKITWPEDEVSA